MSVRWRKYLPGWPAVLLIPAVLGAWAYQCNVLRLAEPRPFPGWVYGGGYEQGFPLAFREVVLGFGASTIDVGPFIVDLVLALATAYTLAMAVDGLVFPFIRSRRNLKRSTRPGTL